MIQGGVSLIEDHSIPSFPHVPEQMGKKVHADRIGQGYSNTNVPRMLDKVTMHGDAKACLDFLRLMKIGEDVSIRLKDTRAVCTPGVLQGPDIPIMEIGTGVQASPV